MHCVMDPRIRYSSLLFLMLRCTLRLRRGSDDTLVQYQLLLIFLQCHFINCFIFSLSHPFVCAGSFSIKGCARFPNGSNIYWNWSIWKLRDNARINASCWTGCKSLANKWDTTFWHAFQRTYWLYASLECMFLDSPYVVRAHKAALQAFMIVSAKPGAMTSPFSSTPLPLPTYEESCCNFHHIHRYLPLLIFLV